MKKGPACRSWPLRRIRQGDEHEEAVIPAVAPSTSRPPHAHTHTHTRTHVCESHRKVPKYFLAAPPRVSHLHPRLGEDEHSVCAGGEASARCSGKCVAVCEDMVGLCPWNWVLRDTECNHGNSCWEGAKGVWRAGLRSPGMTLPAPLIQVSWWFG